VPLDSALPELLLLIFLSVAAAHISATQQSSKQSKQANKQQTNVNHKLDWV